MSTSSRDQTEGSTSLILPNLPRPSQKHRCLILTIVQLTKRLRPRAGGVLLVSKTICIKYSKLVKMSEAYKMHFVRQNTSIPVPRVLSAFEHCGITFLTMERLTGQVIGGGWLNRSAESRAALLSQLRCHIRELRSLSAPVGMGVANVMGEALYDERLPGSSLWFGPFRSVAEFTYVYVKVSSLM